MKAGPGLPAIYRHSNKTVHASLRNRLHSAVQQSQVLAVLLPTKTSNKPTLKKKKNKCSAGEKSSARVGMHTSRNLQPTSLHQNYL